MLKTKVATKVLNPNSYTSYTLAVTKTGLYILSNDKAKITEVIINSDDNDGYMLGTDDIDQFLDAILLFKACILKGDNPFELI